MSITELSVLVDQLLPRVLADRELGDGRSFTQLHLDHLWALSCLHAGECYDPELLAQIVANRLPPHVRLLRELEVAA